MPDQQHIPPDVLARIGQQYVEFVDSFKQNHEDGQPESYRRHSTASKNMVASYNQRFAGCDRPARFYAVDAGARYTIVACDANHAWLLFAQEVAITDLGADLLGVEVSMAEIPAELVAASFVHDERDGKPDRYPLATAAVGDVFCSEY